MLRTTVVLSGLSALAAAMLGTNAAVATPTCAGATAAYACVHLAG